MSATVAASRGVESTLMTRPLSRLNDWAACNVDERVSRSPGIQKDDNQRRVVVPFKSVLI